MFSATCVGVPWQLRPYLKRWQNRVLPLSVMPVVPRVDQKIRHEQRSLEVSVHKRMSNMHVGVRHAQCESFHDDRCRDTIGELMAGERMTSRTTVEVEIISVQKPEKRWMLVNHRSSHGQNKKDQPRPQTQSVPRPVEEQPIPTESGWIIKLRNPIWSRFESK